MSTLKGSRRSDYQTDTDSALTDPSSAKLTADIQKTQTLEKSLKVVHTNETRNSSYLTTNDTQYGAEGLTSFGKQPRSPGGKSDSLNYSRSGSLTQSELVPIQLRQNVSHRGTVESNRDTQYTTLPLGQTLTIATDVDNEDRVDSRRSLVGKGGEEKMSVQHETHTEGELYSAGVEGQRELHDSGALSEAILRRKQEERMSSRWRTEGGYQSKRRYCCTGHNTERRNWEWRTDFGFVSLMLSLGVGNVWRLPAVVFHNGGGGFFLIYLAIFFLIGCPLMFLEVAIGQYSGQGILTVWRSAPLFLGVGAGMLIAMFFLAVYFSTYVSWAILYLIGSFSSSPSWASCGNQWNSKDLCFQLLPDVLCDMPKQVKLTTGICNNSTVNAAVGVWNHSLAVSNNYSRKLSADGYFHRYLLEVEGSPGMHSPGVIRWQVLAAMIAVWFLVLFALSKGVKSFGKVAYMIGIVWLALLFCLFVRALTLDGYYTALSEFMEVDWPKLITIRAWAEATIQVFFTLLCGWGASIYLGSNNKFHKKSFWYCLAVCVLVFGVQVIIVITAGIFIGVHASFLGTTVSAIIKSEFELPFVVMPASLSSIQVATLWTLIYFVILILSGYGTLLILVACICGSIADVSPYWLYVRRTRLTMVICLLIFMVAIGTCTHAGVYVVYLLNSHVIGWPIIILAVCECLIIVWIYGLNNLKENLMEMFGFTPNILWLIWWAAILPLGLMVLLAVVLVNLAWSYTWPTYNGYVYPTWAVVLGWLVSVSIVIMLLLVAIIRLCRRKYGISFMERLRMLLNKSASWGPGADRHRHYHALDGFISSMEDSTMKKERLYTITGNLAGKTSHYPPTDPGDPNQYEIQEVQLHMRKDGLVDDVHYESHDDLDEIGLDEISLHQKTGSYNVTSQPSDRRSNISVKVYRSNEDQPDYSHPVVITTLPRHPNAVHVTQDEMNSSTFRQGFNTRQNYGSQIIHLEPNVVGRNPPSYAHSEPGFSPRLNPGYSIQMDPQYLSLQRSGSYQRNSSYPSYANNTYNGADYQWQRNGYDSGTHSMRQSMQSMRMDQGGQMNHGYSDYHTGAARVVYPNSVPAYHGDEEPEYRGTMYITKEQQTMF